MDDAQAKSTFRGQTSVEGIGQMTGANAEISPTSRPVARNKRAIRKTFGWNTPANGAARLVRKEDDAERLLKYMQSEQPLCSSCMVVSRDITLLHRNPDENPDIVGTFVWNVELETLLQAVMTGCQFCTLITRKFIARDRFLVQNNRNIENALACCGEASGKQISTAAVENIRRLEEFTEAHPGATVALVVEPLDYIITMDGKRFAKVRFTPVKSTLESDQLRDLLSLSSEEDFSTTIEVFALSEEDCFMKSVRAGPTNVHPGSTESLMWAKCSLEQCSAEHAECPTKQNVPLPTRIVEILADGYLRLATDQPDALYAALSYCWGGPQTFQTTVDTLAAKSERFSISELPKTLQDAVLLTQKLGLRYLWVDSLCIIQDDDSDKIKELANMVNYYSTAHVTICAGGQDCNVGFLAPHSGCEEHPHTKLPKDLLKLPVLYFSDDGSAGMTTLLFRPENTRVRRGDAIEGRAWTLQERILSPRVLHYGYEGCLWQCSSEIRGNGGNAVWKRENENGLYDKFDYQQIRAALLQGKAALAGKEVIDLSQLLRLWHDSVEEYTCRALTNQRDKLPAIEALASRFGMVLQDKSVAGLWMNNLRSQLLWSTFPTLCVVPSHSGAPSWSWASVMDRITYSRVPSHPIDLVEKYEFHHPSTSTDDTSQLRIYAPKFINGSDGESLINKELGREYVLPGFSFQ